MREVGAFEARNTFGTLLDRVQQGEEVVITRRGKPVAKLAAWSRPRIGRRRSPPCSAFVRCARVSRWTDSVLRDPIDEGRQ